MADEPNQNESNNVRQIREALERSQSREKAWKDVALKGLVKAGGFDPQDPIVGLLVTQFNTDDLEPTKLDESAFAKFAEKYNVAPKPAEGTPPPGSPDPNVAAQVQQMQQQQGQPGQPVPQQPQNPQQQQQPQQQPPVQPFMQQFQAPADALLNSAAGTPQPQPTTKEQQVAQAEAAGNWDASFAGKFDLTRQAFNASPQPAQHAGPVNQQGLPVHTPGA